MSIFIKEKPIDMGIIEMVGRCPVDLEPVKLTYNVTKLLCRAEYETDRGEIFCPHCEGSEYRFTLIGQYEHIQCIEAERRKHAFTVTVPR